MVFTTTAKAGSYADQRPEWLPSVDWVGTEVSPLFSMIGTGDQPDSSTVEWFPPYIKKDGPSDPNVEANTVTPNAATRSLKYANYCQAFEESASLSFESQATKSVTGLTTVPEQEMATIALQWQDLSYHVLGRRNSAPADNSNGKKMSSIQNYLGGDIGNVVGDARASADATASALSGSYQQTGANAGYTTAITGNRATPMDADLLDRAVINIADKGVDPADYCIATTYDGYSYIAAVANREDREQMVKAGKSIRLTRHVTDFQTAIGFDLKMFGTPYMQKHTLNNVATSDMIIFDPRFVKMHWMENSKMRKVELGNEGTADSFYLYSLFTVTIENPHRHAVMRGMTAPAAA